jgi:hypothetical protein
MLIQFLRSQIKLDLIETFDFFCAPPILSWENKELYE